MRRALRTIEPTNLRGARQRRAPRRFRLTKRDVALLTWLSRYGVASTPQLARRWFGTPGEMDGVSAARRRLRHLTAVGLVTTSSPTYGQPQVFSTTRQGAHLAGSDLRLAAVVLAELAHDLEVLNLSEYLLTAYPGSYWITEREVRQHLRGGHSLSGLSGQVPDGVLVLLDRRVAIEYERTPKSSARYRSLLERHLRSVQERAWTEVWWVVESAALALRIRAAIEAERASDVASVVLWREGGARFAGH